MAGRHRSTARYGNPIVTRPHHLWRTARPHCPADTGRSYDLAMDEQQLVAVVGRGVVDRAEAVVGADDLGLARGEGVFDATRVVTTPDGSSTVDHLEEHLARLNHSITGLGERAVDLDPWRQTIGQAVEAWQVPGEATLKLIYTSGGESFPAPPVQLLTVTPMTEAALAQREGLTVVLLGRGYTSDAFRDAPWLLGGVKTLSYAVNQAAKHEAHRRGADDVVFTTTDGWCLEGPSAALVVLRDGALVTTPTGDTGILDSITQKAVWRAAEAEGVETRYELIRPDELFTADGVWLLSSVRGAAPVVQVDGRDTRRDAGMDRRIRAWAGF